MRRGLVAAISVLALIAAGATCSCSPADDIGEMIDESRFAEAEALARERLAVIERGPGKDSLEAATLIDWLVAALHLGGKTGDPETLDLARRVVAIREARQGPNHPELAQSLAMLGDVLRERGELAAAREHLERALRILDDGPPSPELLDAIQAMANLAIELEEPQRALELLEREMPVIEKLYGREHETMVRNLYGRGRLLYRAGRFEQARDVLDEAMQLSEKTLGPEHIGLYYVLNLQAIVEGEKGNYLEARDLYERALVIVESQFGPAHTRVASTLTNLASISRRIGDYERARSLLERSLSIARETHGDESPQTAVAMASLGEVLGELGDTEQARAMCEKSLALQERAFGPTSFRLPFVLGILARQDVREGDDERAATRYRRMVEIWDASDVSDPPQRASAMSGLAEVHLRGGDAPGAVSLYRSALSIQEKSLGLNHPLVAEVLAGLAHALGDLRETDESVEVALRSEEISRRHMLLTIAALPEREALRYAISRPRGLDLALLALTEEPGRGSVTPAWDALVRGRTSVLDEMAFRLRALNSQDAKTRQLVDALMRASRRLAHLALTLPDGESVEDYRSRIEAATLRRERAERALGEHSAPFREARRQVGLAEVSEQLEPGSALLAYAVCARLGPGGRPTGEAVYLAMLLRADRAEPHAFILGPADRIEQQIDRWAGEASRGAFPTSSPRRALLDYIEAGQAIRQAVWDPIVESLAGIDTVFVVPDGALGLVNLGALPDETGGFVIEDDRTLRYLSSERDLIPRARTPGQGILLVGDVSFDERLDDAGGADASGASRLRSSCAELDAMRFDPLPSTGTEVEKVRALWLASMGGASGVEPTVLTGPAATESALIRLAPGRHVMHLATHGFFLGAACGASPVGSRAISGLAPPAGSPAAAVRIDNPLLLSGLALAGANSRGVAGADDGILTAAEVAALDLRGLELAVLSACDTGAGRTTSGEGVLGLRRAFRVAGTRAVLMSLWAADDEAAAEWMTEFYRALLIEGQPTAEAVRNTSRNTLQARRDAGRDTHPFFWAGWLVVEGS